MNSKQTSEDNNLTIRQAEMMDASALAQLISELGYPTRSADMSMRMESIVADSRYRTLVAVKNGVICGMVGTFCYLSYEHDDLGGRIMALVVAGTSRRQGVGRRLLAAAEHDFAARGVRRLAVNTRFDRAEAHQFYEEMGYRRNGFRFVKNLATAAD